MKQTIQNLCKGIFCEDWERKWILCLELSNIDSFVYFNLMSSMPWVPQIHWFQTMGISFFTVSMVMSPAMALLVLSSKYHMVAIRCWLACIPFQGCSQLLFQAFVVVRTYLWLWDYLPTSCLFSALGGHSLPFHRDLSKVFSQPGSLLFQGQL